MNELEIFSAALEFGSPEDQRRYLDEACGKDLELRRRIEELLGAHAQAGSFMGAPAPDRAGPATIDEPIHETSAQIGPYKLLEPIGEGGMGTVWMAQQMEPVKRVVALKLIKAGMDSKQVIARFEAERQALAMMDHMNIARVLDAGTTEGGRPYFVMDLVKGVPITKYCDEHQLTPRQRLELFIPVCQAVQHAHQKGIIHRDIKPSNVLVAQYDGRPVPKVIDFGVAKAAGQSLTDKTLVTGFGAIVGTLEYMSPEQAETNQLDIDTRSDIYSLGVLLYELLTGSTPFSKKELEKAGMLEMLRLIREQEPSKPSTKLSSSDALPTLSANRGTEPAKLTRLVRGDLDWIVMKALEKDRNRRYETANGFAQDVQRYLAEEAVLACPPSAGYRLRKFVRRHRGPVLAAIVVFIMLIGCLAVALVSNWHVNLALNDRSLALGQLQDEQEKTAQALVRETGLKNQANEALEQERLALYSYRVSLAHREWYANRVGRADYLLNECPAPLRGWEWHYLKRLCHADLVTFRDHTRILYGATFSLDGKQVVSCGADRFVRIWDAATGQQVRRLATEAESIRCPTFSPDGRLLAATCDQTIRLWDTTTWQEVRTIRGHTNGVLSVAFSPDGRHLAAASGEKVLRIWDVATGEVARTIATKGGWIRHLAYSRDGASLAWDEGTVVVLADGATGKELRRLVTSPFKGGIVSSSAISSLAFSPDGRRLVTGGRAGKPTLVWDVVGGQVLLTIGTGIDTHDIAISPDGRWLATANSDQTVRVWNMANGAEAFVHRGHVAAVHSVAFDRDGERLVSTSLDSSVKIWSPLTLQDAVIGSSQRMTRLTCMAVSPDGQRLALGNGANVLFCEPTGGPERSTLLTGHNVVLCVAFNSDGKRLATGGLEGVVRVWDVETKQQLVACPGHTSVISLGLSPRGGLLASADRDGKVILRDETGVEVRTLTHSKPVVLAISPDGQLLATGENVTTTGKGAAVRIWEVATGQELHCLSGHEAMIQCVAFSADGKLLASSSIDRQVKLWDVASGTEVRTLGGHGNGVSAVAFHPSGMRLAAGTHDGTIVIWDLTTGREALTLRGGEKGIASLAFLRDGATLVAASWDGIVRYWSARR